jgi:hypothetical protein
MRNAVKASVVYFMILFPDVAGKKTVENSRTAAIPLEN